jgi:hypothetical protein
VERFANVTVFWRGRAIFGYRANQRGSECVPDCMSVRYVGRPPGKLGDVDGAASGDVAINAALGEKRKWWLHCDMSAFDPKRTMLV